MFEDYSFHFSLVLTAHSIAKRFVHIKVLSIKPIFTFFFSLSAMNVNWLICLVCIEKEAPATNKKYCWQKYILSPLLSDHSISSRQDIGWNCQADLSCGLKFDNELEFNGLLDR